MTAEHRVWFYPLRRRFAFSSTAMFLALLAAPGWVAACGPNGGTYCQSGPKYGTQCYAMPDVEHTPGAPPPMADPERPARGQSSAPNPKQWPRR
ncbi:MAG TPA: hypothetical protein VFQ61_31715 [Polyangiaceae bacterium]|nr:hypothetical protein [Polyangiaceae bacterium]